MKPSIIIKEIGANSQTEAIQKIRKEYPNAKMITWKFVVQYVGKIVPKGTERIMKVAFVDNSDLVWNLEIDRNGKR